MTKRHPKGRATASDLTHTGKTKHWDYYVLLYTLYFTRLCNFPDFIKWPLRLSGRPILPPSLISFTRGLFLRHWPLAITRDSPSSKEHGKTSLPWIALSQTQPSLMKYGQASQTGSRSAKRPEVNLRHMRVSCMHRPHINTFDIIWRTQEPPLKG